MKKYQTNKLFYNKYFFKLCLYNPIGHIFRNRNFRHARKVLDELQADYERGIQLTLSGSLRTKPVRERDFLDARNLYSFLTNIDDYAMRIEYNNLCLYSNNKDELLSLEPILSKDAIHSFHAPTEKAQKLLEKNVILTEDKDFPYLYKVTLGWTKNAQGFANWAKSNPKQIRIGTTLLNELAENKYVDNMYFYARDDRTLQLVDLMLNNIRRIEKIVKT